MATEPQHSETMSGAPSSSGPADVGANAALILSALSRIEAVVRDERAALASLRTSLRDMAQAIARAKAVADSENAAAMLDEFEHRVDAMIEIAGNGPAAEPAAESDQVPTVSDVVLRLGPNDAAPEPAPAEAEPPAANAGEKSPTVAMLTAMVEALSASIQTPPPEPEAEASPPASQAVEAAAPAPAGAPEFTPWPPDPEATAVTERESSAEPAAEATPSPLPGKTMAQESTLLANFERMESRPFPPPEVGTAVIFKPRVFTSETGFTPPIGPDQKSQAEPGLPPAVVPREPAATPEPDPLRAAEAAAAPGPEPDTRTPLESLLAVPPAAAEVLAAPDVIAAAPEPEAAPPSEAPAEPKPVEAYFDPADFLFGPEPEPDPAAFLLDPAPQPAPKARLPQPEFVSPQSEPLQPEESQPREAATAQPMPSTSEPEPHDPLHALKAMSPNEKLAIFS